MLDPYEKLANAVVLQAASEWRKAAKALRKRGAAATVKGIPAVSLREDTERFFQSKWIKIFTALDGQMILAKLKEEACG